MKQKFIFITFFFFITISIISKNLVKENIEVNNYELIIRVLKNGILVDNLKKSDLTLFIDGKKTDINSFSMKKQKLEIQDIELQTNIEKKRIPRFFVLAFSIVEYNYHYKEGIDYLFNNILKGSDRLLVFINNQTLSFNTIENKKIIKSKILNLLKREGLTVRQRVEKIFLSLKFEKRYLKNELANPPRLPPGVRLKAYFQPYILRFLVLYQNIWNEYKKNFLTLNINNMYTFSSYLNGIDLEKWVIMFYQFEKFPVIIPTSDFHTKLEGLGGIPGTKILRQVSIEQLAETVFPAEIIANFFSNIDASFNLALIPTIANDEYQRELLKKDVSTSFENTFREIIKATGGETYFSSDLKETFKKISEKEDIYYMLTYSPTDSKIKGKIKVVMKNKDFKVLYDNNISDDYINKYLKRKQSKITDIRISNVSFNLNELFIQLIDIFQGELNGNISGKILLHISIKSESGTDVYNKLKTLNTNKNEVDIKIKFNRLKPGKYDLLIDATDILTGKSTFEYLKIHVKEEEGRQ